MNVTSRRIGALFLLVLAAGVSAAAGDAPPAVPRAVVVPAPEELVETRDGFVGRVRDGELPSVALGVWYEGRILWEEAIGWADRGAMVAVTAESPYPVASVSKSITATGAALLAARGRLRLDRPAEEILPDLWPKGKARFSANDLMGHRAGIPHLWHYTYPDRPESRLTRKELVRRWAHVTGAPGERYIYSNLGYGVLAEMIEVSFGATFPEVMEEVLFEPLGMKSTSTNEWTGGEGSVRGYDEAGDPIPYRFRLVPDGGGGFYSSLHDLLLYSGFHLGEIDGTGIGRDVPITRSLSEARPEDPYYRGWGVIPIDGATVLVSDGRAAGGTAAVMLVPEKRLAVVALCNKTGGPTMEAAVQTAAALMPGFDEIIGEAIGVFEERMSAAGTAPTGRFEGVLYDEGDTLSLVLDFTDPQTPILNLGWSAFLLQGGWWDQGLFQMSVQGSLPVGIGNARTHGLVLTMWRDGEELRGIAQEDYFDDRPRYGRPHEFFAHPVSGEEEGTFEAAEGGE